MTKNTTEATDRDPIAEQAVRWHVAASGDDMDWDAFTQWIEASADHRARYREVALADARLMELRDGVRQAMVDNEHTPITHTRAARWGWGLGAVAAIVVAALTLPQLLHEPEVVYATDAQTRTIALADGSQAILAPRSRLTIIGADQRHMRLDGAAWFAIRHDPARNLEIAAGPVVIRDIGTSFDVHVDGSLARVSVAVGRVSVTSAALEAPLTLQRGKELLYNSAAGLAETRTIDPATPGSWRSGELRYTQAPLSLVALDLDRYAGIHLSIPPELRDRRFTGILTVKDAEATKRDLTQLLGLTLVHGADGDRLSTSGH